MFRRFPLFAAALLLTCLAASASDWPQWRGPDRTGISKETGLLKSWPKDGPPKIWTAKVPGGGHGSPIIVEGKIYVLAKNGDDEVAACVKESDGSPVWEKAFNTLGKNDRVDRNAGPRSTPTFHNDPKIGKGDLWRRRHRDARVLQGRDRRDRLEEELQARLRRADDVRLGL